MSYTSEKIEEMERVAKSGAKTTYEFLNKLVKTKPRGLDSLIHSLHFDEFEKINCLECARCCKSLGPMIFESDIERMAATVKMKSSAFREKYIRIDEDGDNVFKENPCPFLGYDNLCAIYSSRPKACKEYPHTNRKRFYQVAIKSYHNSFVCPAVYSIVNKLREKI